MSARISVSLLVASISIASCGAAEPGRLHPATTASTANARTAREPVAVWLGPTAPGEDPGYGDPAPAPLRTTTVTPEAAPAPERPAHAPEDDGELHPALGRAFVAARCEREARCGNVGEDHDYADTAACLVGSVDMWSASYDCPDGIARAELTACLDAIRDADCRTEMHSLDRLPPCRTTRVCRAGDARTARTD